MTIIQVEKYDEPGVMVDLDISVFPKNKAGEYVIPKTVREKVFWTVPYDSWIEMDTIKDLLPQCNRGTVGSTVSAMTNKENGALLEAREIGPHHAGLKEYRRKTKNAYVGTNGRPVYKDDPDTIGNADGGPEMTYDETNEEPEHTAPPEPSEPTPITMETLHETLRRMVVLSADAIEQLKYLSEVNLDEDERVELERLREFEQTIKGAIQ